MGIRVTVPSGMKCGVPGCTLRRTHCHDQREWGDAMGMTGPRPKPASRPRLVSREEVNRELDAAIDYTPDPVAARLRAAVLAWVPRRTGVLAASIAQSARNARASLNLCPECGDAREPHALFCRACGVKLPEYAPAAV